MSIPPYQSIGFQPRLVVRRDLFGADTLDAPVLLTHNENATTNLLQVAKKILVDYENRTREPRIYREIRGILVSLNAFNNASTDPLINEKIQEYITIFNKILTPS